MNAPHPFHPGEPVPISSRQDVVTMVEGTTFCVCTSSGDVDPSGAQGVYFQDARILSRWQLRLDGRAPQALSAVDVDSYLAKFISRRLPAAGQTESTVLVVRRRTIGAGLKESITLTNVSRETTVVRVELLVSADFADLFAVKEGRAANNGAAHGTPNGLGLSLSSVDGMRGVFVHATKEPQATDRGLVWEAMIPPREDWTAEILAQPVIARRRIEPRFRDRPQATDPSAWRSRTTIIKTRHKTLGQVMSRTLHDLDGLRFEYSGEPARTFIAAGAPWFMTLFGRDSLLTAWMTLLLDPALAVGTLHTLADRQGREVDPQTEEEPGRILHESRLGPDSISALGGVNYYGTVDATPLFVALLGEAWKWGASEAEIRSLLPAADRALSWMDGYGDRDGDGFLEYQRATDRGIANQGWKDSWDGINDASGRMADPPVALAEVQGYAYAAWLARADLADAFGEPHVADECRNRAGKLKSLFAAAFWLREEGYFAVALDGHKRPVDALTSNAGQCLWTGIASDEHARILIGRLSESDMDSGFGLRTLSERMGAYNPMAYHNGSVWPHDTALCVAGLMRYSHLPGAVELAHRLGEGLLHAAAGFDGRLPELFCGFPASMFNPPVPHPTSCSPQAWASASPVLLVRAFLGLEPDVPGKVIKLRPNLPASWGQLTLDRFRLAGHSMRIRAAGKTASVFHLPDGWTVDL